MSPDRSYAAIFEPKRPNVGQRLGPWVSVILGGLISAAPVGLYPLYEYRGWGFASLLELLRGGVLGPTQLLEIFWFGGAQIPTPDAYIIAAGFWFATGAVLTLFFRKTWAVALLWLVIYILITALTTLFGG